MAASSLRVVRRPKNAARRALTAASQPVDDAQNNRALRQTLGSSREDWQAEAWEMYDQVGELRYYTGWRASSCSRVRLLASELDEETGLPTGGTDNAAVNDIVKSIAGGPLGQAQLIRRAAECLTVPGEVWIAILVIDDAEQWFAVSKDEIKRKARGIEIELPTGEDHEFDPATDSLFRVWNPRPRRAKEPDSPVRATMGSLNEIVRTTRTISNASKSRLIGNGVVFVPQEMSLPAVSSLSPVGTLGSEQGTALPLEGTPAVQALQELLFQVATTAYDDEDSSAALVPMFAAVPGDQVKNVLHLKIGNEVTDVSIKIRNDAIARLAMGLDVSPERLLGLGGSAAGTSGANHWTAWQIADSDVQLHIAPPMEMICQALTDQVLKGVLEREGFDSTKFVVWYDAGQLTSDPDKANEATEAFDRGAINAEAYRDFLGLGNNSGYDFTTLDGWKTWAQDRVSAKPELFQTLLPLLDPISSIEELAPAPPPQALPPGEAPPPEGENQQEPQTENQQPQQSQTASVRSAHLAVIEVLVGRALELAGKRRRSRADYNRLRDVPLHETHRFMPPVGVDEIPGLIKGWDAALEEDVLERLGIDTAELRAVVRNRIRQELTRPVVDA